MAETHTNKSMLEASEQPGGRFYQLNSLDASQTGNRSATGLTTTHTGMSPCVIRSANAFTLGSQIPDHQSSAVSMPTTAKPSVE